MAIMQSSCSAMNNRLRFFLLMTDIWRVKRCIIIVIIIIIITKACLVQLLANSGLEGK